MSRKCFCDACGDEIHGSPNAYSGPCHLLEEDKINKHGYADFQGNPVSGRRVDFDLCNRCSNRVHGAASTAFFTIRKARKP